PLALFLMSELDTDKTAPAFDGAKLIPTGQSVMWTSSTINAAPRLKVMPGMIWEKMKTFLMTTVIPGVSMMNGPAPAVVPRQSMVSGWVIVTGAVESLPSRQETIPPRNVTPTARAMVAQGCAKEQSLASLPAAETKLLALLAKAWAGMAGATARSAA